MTRGEAEKLCRLIPSSSYTTETGFGAKADHHYSDNLRIAFPGFNWRIILDRSGQYSRWALTIDDNDPREHYFERLGGKCVHCHKTAHELAVGEEGDEDGGAVAVSARIDKLLAEMPPGRDCPTCGMSMVHYRLKGYQCPRCN